MPLTPAPNKLILQIIIPFCRTAQTQQALYNQLFTGIKNKPSVQFGGSARDFAVHFKEILDDYGQISPGVPALWDLLDRVIREQVGVDIGEQIDSLREGFFPPIEVKPPPPPPPPLKPQSERYKEAMTLLEAEQYEPALALLEQLAQEGYTPRYVSLAESIALAKGRLEAQAAYSDLELHLGLRTTSLAQKQAALDNFLKQYPEHGDPKAFGETITQKLAAITKQQAQAAYVALEQSLTTTEPKQR
jgi:hypothetical protein